MNNGKRFEKNFKNSIPKNILFYRFKDGTSSWDKNKKTRFQCKNICDCMLFDGKHLFLMELKSTKGKSLPLKNIKEHQINDLLKESVYENVICGLVIEFNSLNECYFVEINQFKQFFELNNRKSISIRFCREKGVKIGVELVKINRKFDIENFIKKWCD